MLSIKTTEVIEHRAEGNVCNSEIHIVGAYNRLLGEYEAVNPLSDSERRQLFYRLAYPEKFRKIANFYYNSNKAFLSGQYMAKLENILRLENSKAVFLRKVFDDEI